LRGIGKPPDPDHHVSARSHVLWQIELHPVTLVDESLIWSLDAGVSWVAEGVVGKALGLKSIVRGELGDVEDFIFWLALPVHSDGA
jgi:hypothetical protein